MAALANSAEGGTDGVGITEGPGGNTGGASGDYLDGHIGASAATFSNAHPATGGMGYRLGSGAANQTSGFVWARAIVAKEVYGRMYLYLSALPGSGSVQFRAAAAGSTIARAAIDFSTDTFAALDALGTGATGSTTITADTLYRMEWHFVSHASAGVVEVSMYAGHAVTPLETLGPLTGRNTNGADIGETQFSITTDPTTGSDAWVDDVAVSDVTWLGPSGSDTPPAVPDLYVVRSGMRW